MTGVQTCALPIYPVIGSNIRRLLFDIVNDLSAAQIEREITETIENFEPRARVSKVDVFAAPDQNGYSVTLEFFIVNLPNPVSITFFLERIR